MTAQTSTGTAGTNGQSTLRDLFALTDEQILQIEPEAQDVEVVSDQQSAAGGEASREPRAAAATVQNDKSVEGAAVGQAGPAQQQRQPTTSNEEPPLWLAAQMKDPWTAGEAKELWNGVQQARQEAAAYRAAIATPEDARALKELYPGGVTEARRANRRRKSAHRAHSSRKGCCATTPRRSAKWCLPVCARSKNWTRAQVKEL
jgi:hypothetical protein